MEEFGEPCDTQAIGIQNGALDKCDFLRQAARFIILNKDYLPDDTRLSLFDAFGKKNKSFATTSTRSRANNARSRVEQAREVDIMPSAKLLTSIKRIGETPSEFWTAGLSEELDWDANILRHIYHGNRRNNNLAIIYRTFYTTATYLFISYCIALIDPHCEDTKPMKQNLKEDYKAGLIWNTYAEHLGGYGAFFLIGVAPTWVFEISLNQGDDLLSAVSHFKSIKVPQTAALYGLHAIGSKIISEITRRAGSSLPQQRPKQRNYKIRKPPNSSRSKSANVGANVRALERITDQLVSSENRALQDDRSSVPSEVNQPHTQCISSALGNEGLASSSLGSFTAPRNHVPRMGVSQMPLQYDGTITSQQTTTAITLGSPVSSRSSSFSTSSAPSPHTRYDTPTVIQPFQESATAISMPQTIETGARHLESRLVADSLGGKNMSLNDQQIPTQGQETTPSRVLDNAPSVVQNGAFAGPDAYPGSIYPFNPLDYPNLLPDQLLPDPTIDSDPELVFNPLDYPNLPPDQLLPDPQTIGSGPEFVFNPLDYPNLPPDQLLPDPQTIGSDPEFVFNPLDYPNLPPGQLLPDPQTIGSVPELVFNPLDYPNIP